MGIRRMDRTETVIAPYTMSNIPLRKDTCVSGANDKARIYYINNPTDERINGGSVSSLSRYLVKNLLKAVLSICYILKNS